MIARGFIMRCVGLIVLLVVGWVGLCWASHPESSAGDTKGDRKPYGLEKRVPWTASNVKGSAEPPPPYKTEPAFPKLPKFEEPLDLTYAPGTDRLFVAERWGKIFSFVNKKDVDKADLAWELTGAKDSKGQPMR